MLHARRQDDLVRLEGAVREVGREGIVLAGDLSDLGLDHRQVVPGELVAGDLEDVGRVGAVLGEEAVGVSAGDIAAGTCGAKHAPAHAPRGVQGGAEAHEAPIDDQDVVGRGRVMGHGGKVAHAKRCQVSS